MSKKMMLIALAAMSATLVAVPTVASAQEMEVDPGAPTQFTGNGGASSIKATGEPTITCETLGAEGELLSKTTATLHIDFKECHIVVLGATIPCRSFGAPLNNTLAFLNIMHFITFSNKPAVLVTPPFPTIICETAVFVRKIEIGGNGLIGTITAPACNVEAKAMTIKFTAKEGKQDDMLYTNVNYDLTAKTEGSAAVTASLEAELALNFGATLIKMTCQ